MDSLTKAEIILLKNYAVSIKNWELASKLRLMEHPDCYSLKGCTDIRIKPIGKRIDISELFEVIIHQKKEIEKN